MALSDSAIRAAKPAAKPYKMFDEGGLFVLVSPSGGKLWRMKFRHLGKEQLLSLGRYPDVGLKDARARRDEARKLIAAGVNPAFEKKRQAIAASMGAANTFKAVAEEFIAKREKEGLKTITTDKAKWLLSQLEPALGARPIAEIEPYELLAVLKKVELSGRNETARRLLAFAGRVFRYAVATTRASRNIAADLQGALVSPKVKHHAAIIDPKGVGDLLRAIDGFDEPVYQMGMKVGTKKVYDNKLSQFMLQKNRPSKYGDDMAPLIARVQMLEAKIAEAEAKAK